uniref:Uncharacterized protein n=1 Tax=Romanomermis culicivorax TaxID=13658 RepID=A0A915IQ74_ROMCU
MPIILQFLEEEKPNDPIAKILVNATIEQITDKFVDFKGQLCTKSFEKLMNKIGQKKI